jgi:Ca2+-transporting ATPase
MRRPPFSTRENIFARGMGVDVLWVGLLMGLVSLGMGYYVWISGSPTWQTMIFTTLTLSQMGNVLAIRTERQSLFKVGLFSNRAILGAVLLTFLLQMAVVYVPFMQGIFNTIPLPLPDLAISLVMSTVVFFGVEIKKWFVRRGEH